MSDLKSRSIDVILKNQDDTGAYIASPNFKNYSYSWLRDGSFIGYSMLVTGNEASTLAFLEWVHEVVLRYKDKVEGLKRKTALRLKINPEDYLPARYTLDGYAAEDDWPNFQIDGYGAWLWLISEYIDKTKDEYLIVRFQESIRLVLDYLNIVWQIPNYDCWEENGDKVHPSTLACIYGGINSINKHLFEAELKSLAEEIKTYVLHHGVMDGRFTKYIGSKSVDSSLIWLSVPFGLVDIDDSIMKKTVTAIESALYDDGGVKRFPEDTYYGGGQWILLSSWLGWYHAKMNNKAKTTEILEWVEKQANHQLDLPEQVLSNTNEPSYIKHWEELWGKVASPLLWSHAMYLVLLDEVNN